MPTKSFYALYKIFRSFPQTVEYYATFYGVSPHSLFYKTKRFIYKYVNKFSLIMRFLDAIKCVDFKTELCKANSSEMKKHEIQTDRITSLVMCPERLVQGKTEDEVVQQYFVRPLVQFMCGLVKTAGKSLLEVLDDANCDVKKEVEACAI